MAVYGYVRVSTLRQVEEGESLGAQQRAIEGYAMMRGFTIDTVYIERAVSGSKPIEGRIEGAKMLARLKPGDVIVTPKLDRMFRSALNALDVLAQLKARRVSLHMLDLGGDVTDNGISKLVFTILSAVAEAERDRTRERIQEVKNDQRKRGMHLGGTVPFGYTKDPATPDGVFLREEPEQQQAIAKMRELRAAGISLREIASILRVAGHQVSHETVSQVLRRKA